MLVEVASGGQACCGIVLEPAVDLVAEQHDRTLAREPATSV
jgi:hypothetical protein